MLETIPSVDLQKFKSTDPQDKAHFVRTLGSALSEIGFFVVKNHGIDLSLIDSAYQIAQTFFELPVHTKKQYEMPGLAGQRGYTSFGKEHAKNHQAPDLKEFWHVGRELMPTHSLYQTYPKNIWPQEISAFKEVMLTIYQQLDTCAQSLLQACALYIGEPSNRFSDMAQDGNTILRVIHYPPIPPEAHPQSIRSAPHEDINLITLLCEATAGGLELQKRDGSWFPVKALYGDIIADAGDMLQNVTNGVYKSTTHRVVNPNNSKERRFSMPFFVHPRSEVSLNPLDSCIKRMGEKKYPDITAGQYLAQRLQEIGLKY